MSSGSLIAGFIASSREHPDRPALEVDGRRVTYAELSASASGLAAALLKHSPDGGPPLTGILGGRSRVACTGVVAALLRGHGYVPLNPAFPAARTRGMLLRAGCRAVVVDAHGETRLDAILEGVEHSLLVVMPDRDDVAAHAARWPLHRFLGVRDLPGSCPLLPPSPAADAPAYLLFTSGSTGIPKGVAVAHRNVNHFVDVMVGRYAITEHDRLSQMFELVFDLSVFNLFVAWARGACVCIPSRAQVLTPAAYINDARLTIWFSVPSAAVLMKELGVLEPEAFPGLRVSAFCGEALTAEVAAAWSRAAPNSTVDNLYGPTELTVACTHYRWDAARSPAECEGGVVPIGTPFPGAHALVVDEALREVVPGAPGELLVAGPQLTLGYWNDPALTETSFVRLSGSDQTYYRTGDLVRRPLGAWSPLCFLGRLDHQIKLHGMRIELGEIEAVLREEAGVDVVVAIGWPITDGGVQGIVAFIGARSLDLAVLEQRVRRRLPAYMVPRTMYLMPEPPRNPNGKIDRNALVRLLASR